MTDVPSNPRLVEAMRGVRDASLDGLEGCLRALLAELVLSTLIAGDDGELSSVQTEDEQVYLALFTDSVELHFFGPGSRWVAIAADEAIRRVADGEYDGLVVNPGSRQFELSREDVLEFFDIDDST